MQGGAPRSDCPSSAAAARRASSSRTSCSTCASATASSCSTAGRTAAATSASRARSRSSCAIPASRRRWQSMARGAAARSRSSRRQGRGRRTLSELRARLARRRLELRRRHLLAALVQLTQQQWPPRGERMLARRRQGQWSPSPVALPRAASSSARRSLRAPCRRVERGHTRARAVSCHPPPPRPRPQFKYYTRYLQSAGYVWLTMSLLFGAYTLSQIANSESQGRLGCCSACRAITAPRAPCA